MFSRRRYRGDSGESPNFAVVLLILSKIYLSWSILAYVHRSLNARSEVSEAQTLKYMIASTNVLGVRIHVHEESRRMCIRARLTVFQAQSAKTNSLISRFSRNTVSI